MNVPQSGPSTDPTFPGRATTQSAVLGIASSGSSQVAERKARPLTNSLQPAKCVDVQQFAMAHQQVKASDAVSNPQTSISQGGLETLGFLPNTESFDFPVGGVQSDLLGGQMQENFGLPNLGSSFPHAIQPPSFGCMFFESG